MKLDPFQPILRPHGFLRPLHYYSFSFSPKHLPSLNTPPLSKQVAVLLPLSLSLYTDTNKRIFVFDSSPAGGECESSRAERFAVHSTLLALRMGTMGARGKRGPPFWHDSQKEAERGERRRDRGGDCVARIANYRFRFFREFLLSSLAERGEHWMNFSNLSWNHFSAARHVEI